MKIQHNTRKIEGEEQSEKLVFFTISSRNYMSYAGVLLSSIRKHYPDADLFLALADSPEGVDAAALPYSILSLNDLEDARLWSMAEKYNITEFNTAIKPFAFSLLMERYPDSVIMYFDPDILLLSPLDELLAEFADGANCVLTPHLLQPTDHLFSRDEDILKYGIYNLGFVAMRANEKTMEIAEWWSDRMEDRCLIDFPNGLFVDQKWCDLIPAFLDKTVILRHPGYNIAYWNLVQRRVVNRNGQWLSNEKPVRFIHFSGFDPLNPSLVSRHASRYHHMMVDDLGTLVEYYREKLFSGGLRKFGQYNYAFRYSGSSGAVNVHTAISLSSKLKGDRGMVDHALPAFGHAGTVVTDSIGDAETGDMSCLSLRSADMQAERLGEKNPEYRTQRLAESAVLGLHGDIVTSSGVCAACRATTPFLVEVSTKSSLRSAEWSRTLECRCGHDMSTRALVHAMMSNLVGKPIVHVMVEGASRALTEWLNLRFPKCEDVSSECVSAPAQVILAVMPDDNNVVVNKRIQTYFERLDEEGSLFLLDARNKRQQEVREIADRTLSSIDEAGFVDGDCSLFWSQDYGYLGSANLMFTARKRRRDAT